MKIKKKGVAPVIATIAIILLTVAAAGFIAGFIVPFVKNQLHESTECVDYNDYFLFDNEFGYNCYVNASSNWLYGLSIRADSADEEVEQKVKGFRLVFVKEGSSDSVSVERNGYSNNSDGGIRMLNSSLTMIQIPSSGEVRTYVYNNSQLYSVVEIYSLLETGRMCDKSDSIRLNSRICLKNLTT